MKYLKIALILFFVLSCYSVYSKPFPRALPVHMTTEDVIELSNAGISDKIIIKQIKATQTVFCLANSQIIKLKQAGVKDKVINFMIGTSINIPRAIIVKPPIQVHYYYDYDPWYDNWRWNDPWCDNDWYYRHGFYRRRHYW